MVEAGVLDEPRARRKHRVPKTINWGLQVLADHFLVQPLAVAE
jgi:hypothetical protein